MPMNECTRQCCSASAHTPRSDRRSSYTTQPAVFVSTYILAYSLPSHCVPLSMVMHVPANSSFCDVDILTYSLTACMLS